MTLSAGAVSLPVRPNTDGFGATLAESVRSQTVGIIGGVGKVIGGTLMAGVGAVVAVGAAGVGLAISGGISRALNIQDAQAQLTGLGHSTTEVTEIMKNALASVKGTAFGLDAAAGVAASAVAAGIQPGEDLTRTLKLTADAATIAKVPLNEMGQIIGKVASNQKLTTDVLQQFQDRGVPLLQMVATHYGVTSAAAQQMVTDGKVSFADFQDALEKGVGGAALASGTTARGAFANVRAALSRLGAEFVTPAITGAPGLLTSISGAVDALAAAVKPAADAFGARLLPFMKHLSDDITAISTGGGIQRIGSLFKSTFDLIFKGDYDGGLTGVLGIQEDSPVIGIVLNIRDTIVGAFGAIRTTFVEVRDAVGPTLAILAPTFASVIPPLMGIFTALSPVHLIFSALAPFLPELVSSLVTLAGALAGALSGALGAVVPVLASLVSTVVGLAVQVIQFLLPGIIAFSDWLSQNIALVEIIGGVILAVVVGFQLYEAAMNAVKIATEIWTGVQWLLNVALDANPIGIVITVIAALVAGIIWVATQTTFFQDVWKGVTDVVGAVVTWLWESVISPVFSFIADAITNVGGFFTWLWETIIKPVVDFIVGYFQFLGAIVIGLWVIFVQPVIQAIAAAFDWLWTNAIQPVVNFIVAYIQVMAAVYTWLWENVISPVFAAIGAIFQWVWSSIIQPVVDFIVGYIQFMAGIYLWLWQNVVSPALGAIGAIWDWLWNSVISPIASFIGDAVSNIGNVVGSVFGAIGDTIRGGFDGVVGFVRGIFNNIIDVVNGIIGGINSITSAAASVGVNVPQLGTLPHLADSGTVLPRPGGTLAVIAEGGRAESVVDTGKLNNLIDSATRTGGRTVTQHVTVVAPDEDPRVYGRVLGDQLLRAMAGAR